MTPQTVVSLAEAKLAQANDVHRPAVLIVDDEKVIADTLTAIFNRSGYAAMAAYDGKSALEFAANVPPELMITDVMMPGMNGIDLAITLEKLLPACKILLFSGQASTADLLSAANAQGHDFTMLTKPVHPTELLRHVSESLQARIPQQPVAAIGV